MDLDCIMHILYKVCVLGVLYGNVPVLWHPQDQCVFAVPPVLWQELLRGVVV